MGVTNKSITPSGTSTSTCFVVHSHSKIACGRITHTCPDARGYLSAPLSSWLSLCVCCVCCVCVLCVLCVLCVCVSLMMRLLC